MIAIKKTVGLIPAIAALTTLLLPAPSAAARLQPRFAGEIDLGQTGTGYFRLYAEPGPEGGRRWWLLDPDGRGFVSVGWNHLDPDFWLQGYNRSATLAKYGADFLGPDGEVDWGSGAADVWTSAALDAMAALHVNSVGYHHDFPPEKLAGVPYVIPFCTDAIAAYLPVQVWPDVFGSAWRDDVDGFARDVIAPRSEDANVLGIAYCDLPLFTLHTEPGEAVVHPWVDTVAAQPADTAGKRAWVSFLSLRYVSVTRFAEVYGIEGEVGSWRDVAAETDWSWKRAEEPDRVSADQRAFLYRLIDERYAVLHDTVRRYDPNHLIWGDKLIPHDDHVEIAAPYVDLILVQWYERAAVQEPVLEGFHELTGLPVLMGDNAFTTAAPCRCEPRGVEVADMEQVGAEYETYMNELLALPYVLGWHHCGVMEQWACELCATGDPAMSLQGGPLDPWERPYLAWLPRLERANGDANAIKLAAPFAD